MPRIVIKINTDDDAFTDPREIKRILGELENWLLLQHPYKEPVSHSIQDSNGNHCGMIHIFQNYEDGARG